MSGDTVSLIVLISSLTVLLAVIGIVIFAFRKQVKDNYSTQRLLTDRELLRLFNEQPDGMMTVKRLTELTDLNKQQARSRLSYLNMQGMFNTHYANMVKAHYSLKEPFDERPITGLSKEPFLTVEDILLLFKKHDYKLTYQKICLSTGLPISVIKEELNYFIKEKVITKVMKASSSGSYSSSMFLLEEPYRSNTDKFLEREQEMNLELEKIYIKELRKD